MVIDQELMILSVIQSKMNVICQYGTLVDLRGTSLNEFNTTMRTGLKKKDKFKFCCPILETLSIQEYRLTNWQDLRI